MRYPGLWLLAVGTLSVGCAGAAPVGSPRATLEAFRAAVRANDTATLYALLPASARRTESYRAFQARMNADRQELSALAGSMERSLDAQRAPTVEVSLQGGRSTTAVEDPDGWRLSDPGFAPPSTPTPVAAARALREALRRGSLTALLRVLSSTSRGVLQSEIAAIEEALSDPATLEVAAPPSAQRYPLSLPNGRTLILVREGDHWFVDDLQ